MQRWIPLTVSEGLTHLDDVVERRVLRGGKLHDPGGSLTNSCQNPSLHNSTSPVIVARSSPAAWQGTLGINWTHMRTEWFSDLSVRGLHALLLIHVL